MPESPTTRLGLYRPLNDGSELVNVQQDLNNNWGIIDLAPDSLTIEITGAEDKINGLLEVLKPYGVLEMARTGRVAMARGVKSANGTSPSAGLPDASDSSVSYSV